MQKQKAGAKRFKTCYPALLIAALALQAQAVFAAAATINIDYNGQWHAYDPARLLGANFGHWIDPAVYTDNTVKMKAAGTTVLRFPAGSNVNEYHWNGTGSYNSDSLWVPSAAVFTPGFRCIPRHRGSTSAGYGWYSILTDGDTSNNSQWKSDTTTASTIASNPYIAINLPSAQSVNTVKIYWGPSYAQNYDIQYWTGGQFNISAVYTDPSSWVTVLNVTNGTGGTETRAIPANTRQCFRILMHQPASIAGSGFTVNEVELYNGATRLTNNTASPAAQTQAIASPAFQANTADSWHPVSDFVSFMNLLAAMGPEAKGVVEVNFGTGTPEEAAAQVQFCKNNGYLARIKYWQIGNEMDGYWESTGPVDAEYSAKRFAKYVQQMKAVDSSIKIAGPSVSGIKCISQKYDGQCYMDTFLGTLQSLGALNDIDLLDWHMYPNYANDNEATTLATSDNWNSGENWKAFVEGLVNKYYGSPYAKDLFLSEYNSGASTILLMDFMNALWTADWVAAYAKAFGPRANACIYTTFNNDSTPGFYDFGYLEIGRQSAAYKYQPRSSYWAMYMINNYLSCPDPDGNTVVTASSSQALLPVYAVRRSDGVLSLMVVNKDKVNDYQAAVNISNFNVNYSAGLYTFSNAAHAPYYTQNYVLHDAARTYIDPDLPPKVNTFTAAANSFNYDFPPYTITIFNFTQAQAATDLLIDNCDDGNNVNNMGGYWYVYDDNKPPDNGTSYIVPMTDNYAAAHGMSAVPFYMQATGYTGSGMAARVTGYVTNVCPYGYLGFGTDLNNPVGPQNIFCCQGIRFWQKGDGRDYRVKLTAPNAYPNDGGGGNMYGFQFTSTAGWSQVTVPFTTMTQEGAPTPWGVDHPAISQVLQTVNGIQWQTIGQPLAGINLWIDQLEIYQCAGGCIVYPTATRTITPSFTATPSFTPTRTRTPTGTITATFTASPTRTVTPTITETLTITATYTITPTFTPAYENLEAVYVFPSLVGLSVGNGTITFHRLPKHVWINFYNLAGEKVYSAEKDSLGGQVSIDLKNIGKKITAGVYIYAITDNYDHAVKGKIAVIR